MATGFFGFSVARRGMSAHQTALNVTAHNIANASTPGFSRQQALFQTTTPAMAVSGNRYDGPGQLGTGVEIGEIRRVRDGFLDYQLRQQLSKLTEWQERHETLSTVEMIVMEPTDSGLSNVFERFWGAWQELAKNPTAGATRASVIETSSTLAASINGLATQGENLVRDLNVKTSMAINDINALSTQLATLNKQIVTNLGAGLAPNDLMDRRDILLDELARIVSFEALPQSRGAINISIGGRHLVHESRATMLGGALVGTALNVGWPDGELLNISGGRLAGINSSRQWVENEFLGSINSLALALHDSVNAVHMSGRNINATAPPTGLGSGENFFGLPVPPGTRVAALLRVNPEVMADHSLIRTAPPLPAGLADGGNALAMARLRNSIIPGGTISLEGFYAGIVTALGVATQQSERVSLNQDSLTNQLINRREETAGVSIDEELANMVQFQHGYQASARLLATLDELLQTVINLGR